MNEDEVKKRIEKLDILYIELEILDNKLISREISTEEFFIKHYKLKEKIEILFLV